MVHEWTFINQFTLLLLSTNENSYNTDYILYVCVHWHLVIHRELDRHEDIMTDRHFRYHIEKPVGCMHTIKSINGGY